MGNIKGIAQEASVQLYYWARQIKQQLPYIERFRLCNSSYSGIGKRIITILLLNKTKKTIYIEIR